MQECQNLHQENFSLLKVKVNKWRVGLVSARKYETPATYSDLSHAAPNLPHCSLMLIIIITAAAV